MATESLLGASHSLECGHHVAGHTPIAWSIDIGCTLPGVARPPRRERGGATARAARGTLRAPFDWMSAHGARKARDRLQSDGCFFLPVALHGCGSPVLRAGGAP